jgi:hypothetical protein
MAAPTSDISTISTGIQPTCSPVEQTGADPPPSPRFSVDMLTW